MGAHINEHHCVLSVKENTPVVVKLISWLLQATLDGIFSSVFTPVFDALSLKINKKEFLLALIASLVVVISLFKASNIIINILIIIDDIKNDQ